MAKKTRILWDRLIILVLSLVLVVGVLGFATYKVIDFLTNDNNPSNSSNNNSNVPVKDPDPVKTNETTKLSLEGYEVYIDDTESLGFNFIIANVKFEANDKVSFDLGNLQTSEKIYLNAVSKYVNELQERKYNISDLGFVSSVVSDQNTYTCKLFIPYTTDSSSLRVMNALDAKWIEFDLTKNTNNITALKFDTDKEIVVGNTNVRVSKSYISNMMTHNGEEYNASACNVYTFNIYVEEIQENIMITDAKFVRNNGDDTLQCLPEEYQSMKINNCIGKKLVKGENGALFFEDSNKNEVSFDGFLMLMFSNRNDWVKIPTTLE